MSTESNALTVRENAVTTMSIADVLTNEGVWNRANAIGKALMKTKYLGNVTEFGATMAVITMAKNNMDPVEFSRAFNVINDKPEMKPNYALGLFKRAGGKYKMNRVDEDVCDMEFTAPDGTYGHFVVEMEKMLKTNIPWVDADRTILKSNWANHPDAMLFARCTGKAMRRVWPEHMGGVILDGERDEQVQPTVQTRQAISAEEMKARVAKTTEKSEQVKTEKADEPAVKPESSPAEDIEDADYTITEPTSAPSADLVDYNLCPIQGPFLNVAFDEMEPDTLAFLLDPSVPERHPELTPAHVENVRAAMKKFTEEA